jgi:uncharacterized protein with HEPN domain
MPDLVLDDLELVLESIGIIEKRHQPILSESDFIKDDEGLMRLDSIAMRLQFIGEILIRIEKLNPALYLRYPEIEWNKIMNLRNFISHHYEMLNHEIIFRICKRNLPDLKITIQRMIDDLSQ